MAAAGDVYVALESGNAAASLTIQPASPGEATVHNVYYAGAVEFYRNDGVDTVKFDSDGAAGARYGMCWHVTNGQWVTIKNVTAGAIVIGFDGIYTKAT